MKIVSKKEFYTFIKNYPSILEKNICGFCEPALLTYNDFSNGKVWPESVIASIKLNENDSRSSEKNEYKIK
jgi:hypothetical protein